MRIVSVHMTTKMYRNEKKTKKKKESFLIMPIGLERSARKLLLYNSFIQNNFRQRDKTYSFSNSQAGTCEILLPIH